MPVQVTHEGVRVNFTFVQEVRQSKFEAPLVLRKHRGKFRIFKVGHNNMGLL